MMDVDIRLGGDTYPFSLDTDWFGGISDRLTAMDASSFLVVADTNVGPLYGTELVERLSPRTPAYLLIHKAGETHKDLAATGALIESALELGADRSSVVVAVGGGITGNIAGLMAALMFRGIRLVHVPTTVVAMLDSVLSLKQAVNASFGKNLVGTFYAPEAVFADTAVLRTLPKREIVSGLCEVVKNALAIQPDMVGLLRDCLNPGADYTDETMRALIWASIEAKALVTSDDRRECEAGLVLEYGHTVGHALEHTSNGLLSHGEAVGLGMVVAAEIAHRRGLIEAEDVTVHRELLTQCGAMTTIPGYLDLQEAAVRLRFDNKRGYLRDVPDCSAMVLLERLGTPVWGTADHPLVAVPFEMVDEVVLEVAEARGHG
jgi:3-dehydroquinate synthase/2-deoxy-scyllo-inosose synthase